jgi:hypothetical protein
VNTRLVGGRFDSKLFAIARAILAPPKPHGSIGFAIGEVAQLTQVAHVGDLAGAPGEL